MIYQCSKCNKLFNEKDGAIISEEKITTTFPIPEYVKLMAFKCKKCIGIKGTKLIEELQNDKSKK